MIEKIVNIKRWTVIVLTMVNFVILGLQLYLVFQLRIELRNFEEQLYSVESQIVDLENSVNGVRGAIDDLGSELSSEIEGVNSTVRIWSID